MIGNSEDCCTGAAESHCGSVIMKLPWARIAVKMVVAELAFLMGLVCEGMPQVTPSSANRPARVSSSADMPRSVQKIFGATGQRGHQLVVHYRDGQLSIVSNGSSLSEVLNEVKAQTGAAVELPSSGCEEAVYANLGPASALGVVAAFLDGSSFNYVLLGASEDPGTSSG